VRGDLASAQRLVPHFLKLAQSNDDAKVRLIAHAALETWSFWRGHSGAVVLHHERAAALVDVQDPRRQHEALMRDYGFEGLLYPALYYAWFQLIHGAWETARRVWTDSVRVAEATLDPYALTGALGFGAAMHHDAGELGAALDLATRVEEIAVKHGFPFWLAVAMVVRGRSVFARGETDAGLGRINEGLGLFRAIGAKTPYPYYLSYLVEALLEAGRLDEALHAVDEALAMTKKNVDRCFRPELYRLKAEAMAKLGDPAAAGWFYRYARALSRAQYAHMFELKTAAGAGPAAGDGRRRKRAPTAELEV